MAAAQTSSPHPLPAPSGGTSQRRASLTIENQSGYPVTLVLQSLERPNQATLPRECDTHCELPIAPGAYALHTEGEGVETRSVRFQVADGEHVHIRTPVISKARGGAVRGGVGVGVLAAAPILFIGAVAAAFSGFRPYSDCETSCSGAEYDCYECPDDSTEWATPLLVGSLGAAVAGPALIIEGFSSSVRHRYPQVRPRRAVAKGYSDRPPSVAVTVGSLGSRGTGLQFVARF